LLNGPNILRRERNRAADTREGDGHDIHGAAFSRSTAARLPTRPNYILRVSVDAGPRAHPARRPRRLGPGWVPREHGAWAMLVVPVVVGAVIAGPTWCHVLLLVTWLTGYCAFSAAGLWLRSGRRARYVPPLRFHTSVASVLGLALVASAPSLLRWAPVFLALLVVSLWQSARRADRSWLNDVVTVLAASLMTVVSAGLSAGWGGTWLPPGADDQAAWVAAALLAGYFLGTVPYVKSLIRNRDDRGVLAVSVGWHSLLVVAALLWALAAPSGEAIALLVVALALLARAVIVPRRRPWPSPKAIGLGEIAATVAVTAVTLVILP
jgi:hypothetical protein